MAKISINGKHYEIESDLAQPLLDFLREDLRLGSVREGCGIGMCGTCTVMADGRAVSSCLLVVGQVVEQEVTTAEGIIGEAGELHPVQEAYLEAHGFQCAFCTPGFILSTMAMLEENPNPSDDEISHYLAGNLCRCGSYLNILEAVRIASSE